MLRALVQQHFSLFVPILSKYLSLLPSVYQERSTVLTIQDTGPLTEFSDPSTGELIWFLISQSWNKNQPKEREQILKKMMPLFLLLSLFSALCLHTASGHWSELLIAGTMKKTVAELWVYSEELGSREKHGFPFLPGFPGCFYQPVIATAELQNCCWTILLLLWWKQGLCRWMLSPCVTL